AAVLAELAGRGGRGGLRGSAVLAELAAAGLLAAAGASSDRLISVVDVLRPVDVLDLLVQLLDLRLRLHSGDFLVKPGRARRAQAALVVPADLVAYPLAAAVTLLEVGLHVLDGLLEGLVAGRAAHGVAHELGVPAELRGLLADRAPQHVPAEAKQPPAEARNRVLEWRHVAISAASAVEFELVSVVRAAV